LFDLVSSKLDCTQFKWKENEKFLQDSWDSEHELLLKKIEEKFQKYSEQWVNSSAGEAFVEMINASRYILLQDFSDYRISKVKMPTLKRENLVSLQHRATRVKVDNGEKPPTVKSEMITAHGIEWCHRQIYDIFGFLSELTEVEEVRNITKDPNSPFESASSTADSDEIYGTGELDCWFVSDMPAVKSETEHGRALESWYSRLASVATAVLLQLLHIHYEFADHRGKKQYMSQQTIRNLLMRMPTRTSDDTFPPFPISPGPLAEWVEHYETTRNVRQTPEPTHPFDKEKREIDMDKFAPMNESVMSTAVRRSEGVNSQAQDDVVSEFIQIGGNIEGYTERDFFNILSIPLASEYPQRLSDFERRFANSSAYGQAALMLARFDNEILRMSLLRKQCLAQEEFLKTRREELIAKVTQYRDARASMNASVTSWNDTRGEISDLEVEKADFEKNPVFKSYGDRIDAAKTASSFRTPFRSPSVGIMFIIHPRCMLISSGAERRSSGSVKVPESSHILAQVHGYSNAIQEHYMDEILGLQPPLEILDNARKSSQQLASVTNACDEPSERDFHPAVGEAHGDNL